MIDGSKHDFEENIALTKQVTEYAHAHGVVVEAELGKLAGVEDDIKVDARFRDLYRSGRGCGVRGAYRRGFSGHRYRNKPRGV